MKKAPEWTDEDVLWVAKGPDGCHADTDAVLAACRRLEASGDVYEGPYKNLEGNPVFFAKVRRVEGDDGSHDYRPLFQDERMQRAPVKTKSLPSRKAT